MERARAIYKPPWHQTIDLAKSMCCLGAAWVLLGYCCGAAWVLLGCCLGTAAVLLWCCLGAAW
eukprot:9839498-Lingulodinium_polyedra.AAC.1